MNYILFNADGSINTQHLDYYIMQGSVGVNEIFVAVSGTDNSNTAVALFVLPNHTTSTIAGVYQADYEYAEGLTANGWLITLTSTETLYNGLLKMSILVYTGTTLLLTTYPVALVINETGYRPDADTGVTIEELNSYLQQLTAYATLDYVDTALEDYLPLSGGTMSGAISQPVAPVADNDLANKKYVDDEVAPVAEDIAEIIYGVLTVHTAYHAEMDVYGNVIPTYYQPKLTFDNTPTTGSANPVTSGGIKTYVDQRIIFKGTFGSVPSFIAAEENNPSATMSVAIIGDKPFIMLSKRVTSYPHFFVIADGINGSVGRWTRANSGASLTYVNYVTETSLLLKQSTSEKGQANGYASLDSGGKVPSTQLPAYVDDILEFANLASFPATGTSGIIYVALDTNLTYRWSGSGYTEISPSLALGETSATAYRGDKGKTAYDHSQLVSGNPHSVTKSDVGLGNVINPNEYNNIGVATDLDTITISGTYTCYGNANGVPSADYSWFILHLNSGVGTAYAKQIAFAYDGKIYVRFKSTTWGAWEFIPASTLGFDNTIKNLLTATNLQEAVDEVSEKVSDITATYAKMISGTTFAGYVASPSISHSGYYVINDDTSLIYLKGSLYSLTSAGVVTLISSTSESWYGSQEEYDDIAVKNPNTMYYIEEA